MGLVAFREYKFFDFYSCKRFHAGQSVNYNLYLKFYRLCRPLKQQNGPTGPVISLCVCELMSCCITRAHCLGCNSLLIKLPEGMEIELWSWVRHNAWSVYHEDYFSSNLCRKILYVHWVYSFYDDNCQFYCNIIVLVIILYKFFSRVFRLLGK